MLNLKQKLQKTWDSHDDDLDDDNDGWVPTESDQWGKCASWEITKCYIHYCTLYTVL